MSLEDGAKTAVNICMGVKKGEKVLIITDTVKEKIGEALFQAEDGIRDRNVTGVQTCALPIFFQPP